LNLHCEEIVRNPIPIQEDKATEIIYKTGGFLGSGLKWFGSKTVDLVNNLGEYINTKISPSQD
jgi:hypothetical protein